MSFIAYVRDLEKENERRELHYIDYARSLENKRGRHNNLRAPKNRHGEPIRRSESFVVERSVSDSEWTPFIVVRSREQVRSLVEDCSEPTVRYRCEALNLESA